MRQPNSHLDFLAVGTITQDILEGIDHSSGYILGGTVTFAAITALCLGRHPTIITRASTDIDLSSLHSIGGPGKALIEWNTRNRN